MATEPLFKSTVSLIFPEPEALLHKPVPVTEQVQVGESRSGGKLSTTEIPVKLLGPSLKTSTVKLPA